MKMLTIFTPTYNRKKHLTKLYDSLTRQSSKGIKWMIIDDGSVDNTKSVVENWKSKGIIEIEYYRQENQGKHIAMKTAIQHCTTDWFLCVDSDDTLSDHAVSDMYQDILCAPTDPSFLGYIYPRKMNDSDKRNAFVEDQMINIMDAKNIYKILLNLK